MKIQNRETINKIKKLHRLLEGKAVKINKDTEIEFLLEIVDRIMLHVDSLREETLQAIGE